MLQNDKKFNEFQDAVVGTALMLNQIGVLSKSKELRTISACAMTATHVMDGVKELSNAVSAISAAGAMSALSVMSLATGVGAVFGAISMATSLLGDEEDEGNSVGDLVMAMWQDMLANFDDIRDRIIALTSMVQQLDESAQKRFTVLLHALEFSHNELASKVDRLAHATAVGFEQLKLSLGGYFKHDVLLRLHTVHGQISTRVYENITLDDVSSWAAEIHGVASTFASSLYNGDTRDDTGALVETGASNAARLLQIHAPKLQQDQNLPLGFVQAVAQEILPESAGKASGVINPQHWFDVVLAYIALVDFYSERILRQPYIADGYVSALKKLLAQAKDTEDMLTGLTSERFWTAAVKPYQKLFDSVRDEIETAQPSVLPGRQSFPLKWDITKSVEQNLQAFAKGTKASTFTQWQQRASPLHPNEWVSLKATRDHSLIISQPMRQPWRDVPQGDLNLVLQERQLDELLGDGTFKARVEDVLKHRNTKLLYAYLDAKPGLAYSFFNIGACKGDWDFMVDLAMTIVVQSTSHTLPFVQGSLFRRSTDPVYVNWEHWGYDINLYVHRTPRRYFGFRYNERSDFYTHTSNILEAHLLTPVCASVANKLVGTQGTSEKVTAQKESLRLAHAQIVSILRLLDSSSKVSLELPKDAVEQVQSLWDLSNSHTCASLGTVLSKSTDLQRNTPNGLLSQKHWQGFLSDYVGSNLVTFDAADLAHQVAAGWAKSPLLKKLQDTQKDIQRLIKKLDPTANGASAKELIADAAKVMERHYHRLDGTLTAMQEQLNAVAALDTTGAEALRELAYSAKALVVDVDALYDVEAAEEEESADAKPEKTSSSMPDAPPASELTSRLQQLCAVNAVDLAEVSAELEVLSSVATSIYWDTVKDPKVHPLLLATRNGRDDVVKLLLQHDPPVSDELFAAIAAQELLHLDSRSHLLCVAHVHFFRAMQDLGEVMSERGVGFGHMLTILHDGLEHMLQSPTAVEHAVMAMGPSKNGKSTIANVLNGIEYEIDQKILEEQGFVHLRAVQADPIHPIKEYVRSSSSSRSETTFPTIVPGQPSPDGSIPGYVFVDMAGFSDTRGPTYSIAEGILAEFLGKIMLRSVKMAVLVVMQGQLGANKKEILDSMSALGRLFDSTATMEKHLLLVINAASEHFTAKHAAKNIAELRTAHEHLITSENNATLAVLSDPSRIMVIPGVPGKAFRESLHQRLASVESAPVDHFRFEKFGAESQAFRVLLKQLRKYHSDHLALLKQGVTALAGAAASEIGDFCRPLKAWHYDERLSSLKALPEPLELKKEETLQQLKEVVALSDKVGQLCDKVLPALDSYGSAGAPAEHLEVLRARVMASESFLRVIDNMLARGNPDSAYSWSTPPDAAPASPEAAPSPTNETVIEDAAHDDFVEGGAEGVEADINSEGVGSAWPFPGAAATRYPYRGVHSDRSMPLGWQWESVYVPLMLLYHPLHKAALRLGQAFSYDRDELPAEHVQHVQTRAFNGVSQPACVHDWRSAALSALLPRTTILSAPSANGHLLPQCQHQQVEFTMGQDSALRLQLNNDTELPSVAGALGTKDISQLLSECSCLAKSGLVAFLLALLRPVLSSVGKMTDATVEGACGVANLVLVAVLYSPQMAAFHTLLMLVLAGVCALLRTSSNGTALYMGRFLADHLGSVVFSASLLFYLHRTSQVEASSSGVVLRMLYFLAQCGSSNLSRSVGKYLGRRCGEVLTKALLMGKEQ